MFSVWERQYLTQKLLLLGTILFLVSGFAHKAAGEKPAEFRDAPFQIFMDTWNYLPENHSQEYLTTLFIQLFSSRNAKSDHPQMGPPAGAVKIWLYGSDGRLRFHQQLALPRTGTPENHFLIRLPVKIPADRYRALIAVSDIDGNTLQVWEHHFRAGRHPGNRDAQNSILLMTSAREDHSLPLSRRLIPYPAGIYGRNNRTIYYYAEIFSPGNPPPSSARLILTLKDPTGRERTLFSEPLKWDGQKVCYFDSLSVSGLAPGPYRLNIGIRSDQATGEVVASKPFFVAEAVHGAPTAKNRRNLPQATRKLTTAIPAPK